MFELFEVSITLRPLKNPKPPSSDLMFTPVIREPSQVMLKVWDDDGENKGPWNLPSLFSTFLQLILKSIVLLPVIELGKKSFILSRLDQKQLMDLKFHLYLLEKVENQN